LSPFSGHLPSPPPAPARRARMAAPTQKYSTPTRARSTMKARRTRRRGRAASAGWVVAPPPAERPRATCRGAAKTWRCTKGRWRATGWRRGASRRGRRRRRPHLRLREVVGGAAGRYPLDAVPLV
jgi:hypothetical protein